MDLEELRSKSGCRWLQSDFGRSRIVLALYDFVVYPELYIWTEGDPREPKGVEFHHGCRACFSLKDCETRYLSCSDGHAHPIRQPPYPTTLT